MQNIRTISAVLFAQRRRCVATPGRFSQLILFQDRNCFGQPMFTPGLVRIRLKRAMQRSEEHTSELQSHLNLVCRLLLEKKKTKIKIIAYVDSVYTAGV